MVVLRNMVIKRNDGRSDFIEDVLYVLEMKCNLLNARKLIDNGFLILMKNDSFEL